jgi:hypothetical protein
VTTSAEPIVVRIDLAPAYVRVTPVGEDPYELGRARVIVGQDTVWVFVDSHPQPKLAVSGRIETFDGRNTTGWQLVTAAGDVVYFKRSSGCLCGSQLRSFRPFPQGLVQGPYSMS